LVKALSVDLFIVADAGIRLKDPWVSDDQRGAAAENVNNNEIGSEYTVKLEKEYETILQDRRTSSNLSIEVPTLDGTPSSLNQIERKLTDAVDMYFSSVADLVEQLDKKLVDQEYAQKKANLDKQIDSLKAAAEVIEIFDRKLQEDWILGVDNPDVDYKDSYISVWSKIKTRAIVVVTKLFDPIRKIITFSTDVLNGYIKKSKEPPYTDYDYAEYDAFSSTISILLKPIHSGLHDLLAYTETLRDQLAATEKDSNEHWGHLSSNSARKLVAGQRLTDLEQTKLMITLIKDDLNSELKSFNQDVVLNKRTSNLIARAERYLDPKSGFTTLQEQYSARIAKEFGQNRVQSLYQQLFTPELLLKLQKLETTLSTDSNIVSRGILVKGSFLEKPLSPYDQLGVGPGSTEQDINAAEKRMLNLVDTQQQLTPVERELWKKNIQNAAGLARDVGAGKRKIVLSDYLNLSQLVADNPKLLAEVKELYIDTLATSTDLNRALAEWNDRNLEAVAVYLGNPVCRETYDAYLSGTINKLAITNNSEGEDLKKLIGTYQSLENEYINVMVMAKDCLDQVVALVEKSLDPQITRLEKLEKDGIM
jgi:hypothetical protein